MNDFYFNYLINIIVTANDFQIDIYIQSYQTGHVVDSNSQKNVFASRMDVQSNHQMWMLMPSPLGNTNPYSFIIQNKHSGYLESNAQGQVYANKFNYANSQKWVIEGDQYFLQTKEPIKIRNLATNMYLHSASDQVYTKAELPDEWLQNLNQKWSLLIKYTP